MHTSSRQSGISGRQCVVVIAEVRDLRTICPTYLQMFEWREKHIRESNRRRENATETRVSIA
jgi:hypothetical protein